MNCLCELAKWAPKAPNAMYRKAVDQPVGYLPILGQLSQNWHLMAAGQCHLCAFEATTADAVEDETCTSGLQTIR
ncbi:MAG: hypothetical protein ABI959_03625 [Candidatus Dormiibacterota bacterium]